MGRLAFPLESVGITLGMVADIRSEIHIVLIGDGRLEGAIVVGRSKRLSGEFDGDVSNRALRTYNCDLNVRARDQFAISFDTAGAWLRLLKLPNGGSNKRRGNEPNGKQTDKPYLPVGRIAFSDTRRRRVRLAHTRVNSVAVMGEGCSLVDICSSLANMKLVVRVGDRCHRING